MKTTIQIVYDNGLFDNFADKVLKVFLFTTRRRPDLSVQVNDVILWFCSKIKIEKKATSNKKIQKVLSSLSLNDVGIYLSDGLFESDIGIVSLHPSKGTHWVVYINEHYFDSYGCAPPQKLSKFKKKKIWILFFFWIQNTRLGM